MQKYAVLTGDVNASSTMTNKENKALEKILRESFNDLKNNLPFIQADHFTCFRGDSWQFVVGNANNAAHAAVYFRASLIVKSYDEIGKRIHSAIAIGFGSIDFFPDNENSAGGGEAYHYSGKCLDKMHTRLPGMNASGLVNDETDVSAILGLIDALIRRWTRHQALAVCFALRNMTQEKIAQQWKPEKVTQQAVYKHLRNAGWPAVEKALKCIKNNLQGL